ncbi:hypothetical protein BSLG_000120 [Batrachochytrium salamandrivorans]|nr:hypothetical protein BSLG_000120 [Batrachochytrium salamandrivorans]
MAQKLTQLNPELSENAGMLIEFVQVMLANSKPSSHVQAQLEEILSPSEAAAFTSWLFELLSQSQSTDSVNSCSLASHIQSSNDTPRSTPESNPYADNQHEQTEMDMDMDAGAEITSESRAYNSHTPSHPTTSSGKVSAPTRLISRAFKQATAAAVASTSRPMVHSLSSLSSSKSRDTRPTLSLNERLSKNIPSRHQDQRERPLKDQPRNIRADISSRLAPKNGSIVSSTTKSRETRAPISDFAIDKRMSSTRDLSTRSKRRYSDDCLSDEQSGMNTESKRQTSESSHFKVNKIVWDLPNEPKPKAARRTHDHLDEVGSNRSICSAKQQRTTASIDLHRHDTNLYEAMPTKSPHKDTRRAVKRASIDTSADETMFSTRPNLSSAKTKSVALSEAANIRCMYFPKCLRGNTCAYFHPIKPCEWYPNCPDGAACMFLHPSNAQDTLVPAQGDVVARSGVYMERSSSTSTLGDDMMVSIRMCKFREKCLRPDCMLAHPSPATVAASAVGLASSLSTPCRNYPDCADPDCRFFHPIDMNSFPLSMSTFDMPARTVLSSSVPTFGRKPAAPVCDIRADATYLSGNGGSGIESATSTFVADATGASRSFNRQSITSGKLCWNGVNCTNRACRFSHVAPLGNRNVWTRADLNTNAKPATSERQFALTDSEPERVVFG